MRITAHPRSGRGRMLGLLALVVVGAVVGYRLLVAREGAGRPSAGAAASRAPTMPAMTPSQPVADAANTTTNAAAARALAAANTTSTDGEDPTPDLSDYVLPGEAPSMAQVIEGLHRRGIRTGLGAFQPPGTSPPLVGLEVPEGFPLPEGYVRHQQATDDGQRIAPILMFHPDVRSVTVGGRRVPVPADRVVTRELAPPGMPLRLVRIPPPRDGGAGP